MSRCIAGADHLALWLSLELRNPGGIPRCREAAGAPLTRAVSKRLSALDLYEFTVYKSPALILL